MTQAYTHVSDSPIKHQLHFTASLKPIIPQRAKTLSTDGLHMHFYTCCVVFIKLLLLKK